MKNETVLYDDGKHQCIMYSFEEQGSDDTFLSINQFLVIDEGKGMVIDPGSADIFFDLKEAIEERIPFENIEYVFFSHQDPDVAGSIAEWNVCSSAKFLISKLWTRFVAHYGILDMSRMVALEDREEEIILGSTHLRCIPAHFLHSPGNFSLYDQKSKILFSGDIGAALIGIEDTYKEVTDFESHKVLLESFHKRYMAGNVFCRRWVKLVRTLDAEMIVPQHGACFKGEYINQFLGWFEELKCGSDLIDRLYND